MTQRLLTRILALLIAMAALGSPPLAQSSPQDTDGVSYRYIATVRKFLKAICPEAMDHLYLMTISMTGVFDHEWKGLPTLFVEIGRNAGLRESGHEKPEPEDPFLLASFEFDPSGGLSTVHVGSPNGRLEVKTRQACRIVDAHPEWSDERVATELNHAGAKFGPTERAAIIAAVPSKALEQFIGSVTVESAEFRLRHQQKPEPIAELYWVVEASSIMSNGEKANWEMGFDAFEGRLTDLSRSPDEHYRP